MKNFISLSDALSLGSLLLTSITALIGGIYWYGNNEKKKYGLERDFGHIRRNQEQMQQGIDLIIKEIDFRFDSINKDVIEIKSVLRMPKD